MVGVANHSGRGLRAEVARIMALDDAARLREEDPFTDEWARVIPTWLIPTRSRFEVDLNRDRESAVYRGPDDAWGLDLWAAPPRTPWFSVPLPNTTPTAKEQPKMLVDPAPRVTFEGFGDNSLTLLLRAYLDNMDARLPTITALHQAINDKFRAAGIVIAFPQRDVHLDTSRPMEVVLRRDPKAGDTSPARDRHAPSPSSPPPWRAVPSRGTP